MIIINKLKHEFRFAPKYVHSGIIIAVFIGRYIKEKEYVAYKALNKTGRGIEGQSLFFYMYDKIN